MREEVNAQRIELFMKKLGTATREAARVYLVGGSTAVLLGWRQ
jgi:UDP-N-acetyl-D-mannosaminuronic acid transferase (WecB/TagA/CpsF family)